MPQRPTTVPACRIPRRRRSAPRVVRAHPKRPAPGTRRSRPGSRAFCHRHRVDTLPSHSRSGVVVWAGGRAKTPAQCAAGAGPASSDHLPPLALMTSFRTTVSTRCWLANARRAVERPLAGDAAQCSSRVLHSCRALASSWSPHLLGNWSVRRSPPKDWQRSIARRASRQGAPAVPRPRCRCAPQERRTPVVRPPRGAEPLPGPVGPGLVSWPAWPGRALLSLLSQHNGLHRAGRGLQASPRCRMSSRARSPSSSDGAPSSASATHRHRYRSRVS